MQDERIVEEREGEKEDEVGDGAETQSYLPPPSLPSLCPGPRMASCLRLLGGAGPRARPSRAQQGPFVTQRLPGPWPLVLGVWADWILSWQPCRCRTPARVVRRAQRSQRFLLLPGSQRERGGRCPWCWTVGAPGEGSMDPCSCWGPNCGLSAVLVNMREPAAWPSLMWLGAVSGSGWLSPIPMPVRPKWGEWCASTGVGGMDRESTYTGGGACPKSCGHRMCVNTFETSERNGGLCVHRGHF